MGTVMLTHTWTKVFGSFGHGGLCGATLNVRFKSETLMIEEDSRSASI